MSLTQGGFQGWAVVDTDPNAQGIAHQGATVAYRSGSLAPLMTWGPVLFRVWPFNFHELDHDTATAWAKKEIAGAANYREWVGEDDEMRHIRGSIFPYRIGGMAALEIFDAYRRAGIGNVLIGGDGRNLGWFVCEKLSRNHSAISAEGIGQQINFEAQMARCPVPDPATYMANVFQIIGNTPAAPAVSV
jgi:uncharacterized protein